MVISPELLNHIRKEKFDKKSQKNVITAIYINRLACSCY